MRELLELIRDVPDFPKPGIIFKDITPVLASPSAFNKCIDALAEHVQAYGANKIVGIEARGFVLAAPVAARLGLGFVPARKRGKLPWRTVGCDFVLEYGQETIEVHQDAVESGEKVVVLDDVLATGGTSKAVVGLLQGLGADVTGVSVLIELEALGGRVALGEIPTAAVLTL